MPIDRRLSKLMTEDLIQSYEALEAQLLKVEVGLPRLWASDEMRAIAGRLAEAQGADRTPATTGSASSDARRPASRRP